MKIPLLAKSTIATLLAAILLIGQVPTMASAAVTPSITLTKIGGEYLGDVEEDIIQAEVTYPRVSGRTYQVKLYDNLPPDINPSPGAPPVNSVYDLIPSVTECDVETNTANCDLSLYMAGGLQFGDHEFTAVLFEIKNNVNTPVIVSDKLSWYRPTPSIILTSNSPFFSSSIYAPAEENYPKVKVASNQYVIMPDGSEVSYYVFDITNNRLLGTLDSNMLEWDFDTLSSQHGTTEYQAYLANAVPDESLIHTPNDLTNIISMSNIVTKTRRPWSVDIDVQPTLGVDVQTEVGGGEYTSYLAEKSTGRIFWNSQAGEGSWASWTAGWQNHPADTDDWAIAYVADKWDEETGTPPTSVSELTDVRANSDKTIVDNIDQPGVSNIQEIAGGWNPSGKCTQSCAGDPVNLYTGEFFDTQTDLSLVGVGLTPTATRHFSTQRKADLGLMGYGWRNSYEMNVATAIAGKTIQESNKLDIIQENGSIVTFMRDSNGSYKTALSSNATLIQDASGNFTFVRNKRDTFTFNTAGKLSEVIDINGNSLHFSYTGSVLNTASDDKGNVVTFSYNTDGTISKIASQNGLEIKYTYNAKRLFSVTDSKGLVTSYTYDANRRVKTIKDARNGTITNTYDSENRVTKQVDQRGSALTFTYEGLAAVDSTTMTTLKYANGKIVVEQYSQGLLIQKTENPDTALERSWYYNYDVFNNLTSTINPDNSITTSTYDAQGNMVTSTNALGGKTEMTYDSIGNLLTSKNPVGHISSFSYDGNNNIVSQTSPDGHVTTFAWNTDGTLASVVDPRGNASGAVAADFTTSIGYNAQGLATTTENALGNATVTSYDTLGRATTVIDGVGNVAGVNPINHTSSVAYNPLNVPASTQDAQGNITAMTYDNNGNVLTLTDAKGGITANTYDLLDNLLTTTDASGAVTTNVYDNVNRKTSTTDALGKVTLFTYDKLDRMLTTKTPLGEVTTYSYDSMDRISSIKDPKGNITSFLYDAAGNGIKSTDALKNVTRMSFNKANQRTSSTDAQGRKTSYEYNSDGNVSKTIYPDETTQILGYDIVGNLTTRTNPKGQIEHWAYDSLNRTTSYTNIENKVEEYFYDANNNMTKVIRIDGSILETTYDSLNRPVFADYPGTTSDTTYAYDAVGQMVQMVANGVTTTMSYDNVGRLLTKGTPGNVVSYTYDARGQNKTLTYPSGRVVTYTYNDNGNMSSLNSNGVGATNFVYDKNGALTTTTLASGITETITLDALNRHTGLAVKNTTTGTDLYSNNKTYTAAGNLLSTAISNAGLNPITETYTHDSMDRTTGNQSTILEAVGNYSYDSTGNITKINQDVVTNDIIGRPLNVGNKTLGYDALGQRINETVATGATGSETTAMRDLEWNVDGTLSEAGNGSGGTNHAAYNYSPDGLISERIEDGVTSDFAWDSTSDNALLLSDGEYEYIYGPNRVPLAQVKLADNTVSYLHTAQNGSVVAVTSSSGVLVGQTNYTAFGKQIGVSYSRFGFAGEWSDEATGYTYLRARWYDPKTASFLSTDPALQTTSDAYGYANGNPLTRIDPSGLWSLIATNPLDYLKQQIIDPITTVVKDGARKARDASNVLKATTKTIGNGIKGGLEAIGKTTSEVMGKVVSAGVTAVKNVGEWAKTVDWDKVMTTTGEVLAVVGAGAALIAFIVGTGGTGFILLGAIATYTGIAGTAIGVGQSSVNCFGQDKSNCLSNVSSTIIGALPLGFLFKPMAKFSRIANTKNFSSGGGHILQSSIDNARKATISAGYLGVNLAWLGFYGSQELANRKNNKSC